MRWSRTPDWTRTEVLEFPGSADGPWKQYLDPCMVNARGIGTVRYPRTTPRDEDCAEELKKRTLTKLYNERPTWLDQAHRKLDEAVFAAYRWDAGTRDDRHALPPFRGWTQRTRPTNRGFAPPATRSGPSGAKTTGRPTQTG